MAWDKLNKESHQYLQPNLLVVQGLVANLFPKKRDVKGVQGWRSGESIRFPPMWPGFDSQTRRHTWVGFFASLLGTERFFSGYSGFLSPQKPTFDFICVNLLILIYSVPDWCSTALEDYSTALQDCNEMDSCWEEEKRKSQNEMETISGKRNDRGWRDLEPDSTVVI